MSLGPQKPCETGFSSMCATPEFQWYEGEGENPQKLVGHLAWTMKQPWEILSQAMWKARINTQRCSLTSIHHGVCTPACTLMHACAHTHATNTKIYKRKNWTKQKGVLTGTLWLHSRTRSSLWEKGFASSDGHRASFKNTQDCLR